MNHGDSFGLRIVEAYRQNLAVSRNKDGILAKRKRRSAQDHYAIGTQNLRGIENSVGRHFFRWTFCAGGFVRSIAFSLQSVRLEECLRVAAGHLIGLSEQLIGAILCLGGGG